MAGFCGFLVIYVGFERVLWSFKRGFLVGFMVVYIGFVAVRCVFFWFCSVYGVFWWFYLEGLEGFYMAKEGGFEEKCLLYMNL